MLAMSYLHRKSSKTEPLIILLKKDQQYNNIFKIKKDNWYNNIVILTSFPNCKFSRLTLALARSIPHIFLYM